MLRYIILIVLLSFSVVCKSQKISHYYNFKIKDIQTPESSIKVKQDLKYIFKQDPTYIDSTSTFEVVSELSLIENSFKYMISDFGYQLLYFKKHDLIGIQKKEEK